MFCRVDGKESLGIGKIIFLDSQKGCVEYFLSPTETSQKVEISKNKITAVSLCPQTRIYYKNPDNGLWKIGRVLDDGGPLVHVQFPNQQIFNLSADELFVRCNIPINDPTDYLSKFLNETPLFANNRRNFVKNILEQRQKSKGMSGLISSVVELEFHQFQIVERILKDPIQKYLLADEVGLGKTIEAGIVIRQYVLDCPTEHSIVIVVPPQLVQQWRNELSRRFLLDYCLDISIKIVPNDDLLELKRSLKNAKMLVVDEVHQIVQGVNLNTNTTDERYQLIQEASLSVDRLLLLSATPVLGNESSFLSMLHLIDPVVYSLSDLESFQRKIANRQPLAHLIAEFSPDNLFFLGDSVSRLVSMFPEDLLLSEYAKKLGALLDECPFEADENIINTIDAIRSHVSDTYKLHRRILRNRRSQVDGLTPSRIGFKRIPYPSPLRLLIANLLEEWRTEASLSVYGQEDSLEVCALSSVYLSFLESLFSSSKELGSTIEKRLKRGGGDKSDEDPFEVHFFKKESQILTRILSLVDELGNQNEKVDTLKELLHKLIASGQKIVVFCDLTETAQIINSALAFSFPDQVASHLFSAENNQNSLDDFLSGDKYFVLVCDQSAEEGINLHGGHKAIVHFDLPISPNRIEQRIGRLDRYGSGKDIRSYGIVCQDDIFENAWVRCLDSGFEIFNRSVASLQYLIEKEVNSLRPSLLLLGVDAIDNLTHHLGGSSGLLSEEILKLELQDQLDALRDEPDGTFYELEDADSEWREFEHNIDSWVENCLLFEKHNHHIEKPLTPDRVFRIQYNHNAQRNTLLPLDQYMENFLPSIDFAARGGSSRRPRSFPFSYRRETAISKQVQLLRYGNAFIDGIMDFTNQDDRGKSFALWRCAPSYETQESVDLFFRFDVIVEVDLGPALNACEEFNMQGIDTMKHALRRQGDAVFPPQYQTVWLNSDFETPNDKIHQDFLELEYRKRPSKNGTFDKNINSKRWEWLWKSNLSFFSDWEHLCYVARNEALASFKKMTNLEKIVENSMSQAQREDDKFFSQLQSRIHSLEAVERSVELQNLQTQKKLRKSLQEGISNPKVTIDSVGAVFLSDFMPSFE